MQIDSLLTDPGPQIYYDDAFRNVLEDYMGVLRVSSSTSAIAIDPKDAYKYEFDLFGLLRMNSIPDYIHWTVMRMNGFTSPLEITRDLQALLIPDTAMLEKIRQSHMSARRLV